MDVQQIQPLLRCQWNLLLHWNLLFQVSIIVNIFPLSLNIVMAYLQGNYQKQKYDFQANEANLHADLKESL
jgi:hypothetical protein